MNADVNKKTRIALPSLVLAATFLVYAGTLGFGFVYDDQGQIVRNLFIQSWHYVPRYFTSHVWSYLFPGNVANYYRPLFLLWLRIDDALFGLKPPGWHLTSVLAHVVVTLEVYWLAASLLKDRRAAAVAAAIFGVHPIHVEAVAWVSGITDPLAAGLMLASFLSCILAREPGRRKAVWWSASLAFYALATLAKETALILPGLIFVYAWLWPPSLKGKQSVPSAFGTGARLSRFRRALLEATPYLFLTAAYIPVRIYALGGFSHALTPVPLATSVLTWPSLLCFYSGKLVWPSGLSPFYDFPYITGAGVLTVFLPALAIALVIALMWTWIHRSERNQVAGDDGSESRLLVLATAWLGLPFLPLIDLSVFGAGDIVHDRYLYIPSIGAALILAAAWKRLARGSELAGRIREFMAVAAVIAVAGILGVTTVRTSAFWSDNLSLYTRGTTIAPNNFRAKLDLANAACDRGFYGAGLKLYAEVIEKAPNFPLAYYDLGVTELELGRLEDADRHLARAIELNAIDPNAYYSLGMVRFREGRLEESAGLLRRALELQPEAAGYHLALGRVLAQAGDKEAALEEFRAEDAAHPQNRDARHEILKLEQGKSDPTANSSSNRNSAR